MRIVDDDASIGVAQRLENRFVVSAHTDMEVSGSNDDGADPDRIGWDDPSRIWWCAQVARAFPRHVVARSTRPDSSMSDTKRRRSSKATPTSTPKTLETSLARSTIATSPSWMRGHTNAPVPVITWR